MKELLSISFCLMLIISCSPKRIDITKPIEFNCYSIKSPNSEWNYEEKPSSDYFMIIFGKPRVSETHSEIAFLKEIKAVHDFKSNKDFMDYMTDFWNKEYNNPRYELLKKKLEFDNKFKNNCIKMHFKYKDKEAVNLKGEDFLIVEEISYILVHPQTKHLLWVAYSERGKPTEMSKAFNKNASNFLEGLTIKNCN